MAIALLDEPSYDIHLRLALEILRLVELANEKVDDDARRFQVRIGVNENVDNVILDINGARNVAGAGISLAQRLMDLADGGQVLVGDRVHEILRQRERYMSKFYSFAATGKHGIRFGAHQFRDDAPGLSTETPAVFVKVPPTRVKFSETAAYFVAHALTHRDFLLAERARPERDYAATVLLSLLAKDSIERATTGPYDDPFLRTWKATTASFEEQYQHYCNVDMQVLAQYAHLYEEAYLEPHQDCFETSGHLRVFVFPKLSTADKLAEEWPAIASEFGLLPESEDAVSNSRATED